jgi:hypothetical protein
MNDESRGQGTTTIPGNPWGVSMYDKPCPHCGAPGSVQLLTMKLHGQRICNKCKRVYDPTATT